MQLSKTTKKHFIKNVYSTNPYKPKPYKLHTSQFCFISLKT